MVSVDTLASNYTKNKQIKKDQKTAKVRKSSDFCTF